MGLNIKDEQTYRLARELASLTGESMTGVIRDALREKLNRVRSARKAGLAERLLAIGKDCAPRFKEPFRSADHGDLLYDADGLPR